MRKTFINKLTELAQEDKDIFLITGDLGFSVFEEFISRFPDQFLNAGLSEQCMIGTAAGMAMEGKKVFVYSIIPFVLYRPLEQIRNDLCYQKVPVKLIGVGSGLAYASAGGTHQAVEDLGIATSLPDMMVFAPGDPLEVERIIESSLDFDLPCYIRLNKSADPVIHSTDSITSFQIGSPAAIRNDGQDVVIFAIGNMLPLAIDISEVLKDSHIGSSVYSVHTLKPINKNDFIEVIKDSNIIVTLEEHIGSNGLKAAITDIVVESVSAKTVLSFHLPDNFIHIVGDHTHLRKQFGLTCEQISKKIRDTVKGPRPD